METARQDRQVSSGFGQDRRKQLQRAFSNENHSDFSRDTMQKLQSTAS